jgi:sulfite exporter TauE/SafE
MLTSITPLGERGRNRRWSLTTAWYLAGSTLGGAAVGALAGAFAVAVSQAPASSRALLIVAALVCAAAALTDARGRRPPSWHRQVDETWLQRYRGWVVGGGFGIQLGFGVVTIVTSASVYAALLLAVLTGSFWAAVAIGTTFGLLRAMPLLAARGVRSGEALAALHRAVNAIAPRARAVTVWALAAGALALAATAMASAG